MNIRDSLMFNVHAVAILSIPIQISRSGVLLGIRTIVPIYY